MNKWENKECRYVCWDDNCKWPEYVQTFNELDSFTDEFMELYRQRVVWLYDNIDSCERHCRWIFNGSQMFFRFRHDRDRTRFILRWS